MISKPKWALILLALAAAVVTFVTTLLPGCSVAIHGRVASWMATARDEPPPVPEWGTMINGRNRNSATTKPASSVE